MELAVAGKIVGQGFGSLDKSISARRLEDLNRVGGEIQLQRKVCPHAGCKGRGEELLGSRCRVALENEIVLGAAVAADEGAGAHLEQVCAKVCALEEGEEVLVADVEGVGGAGLE